MEVGMMLLVVVYVCPWEVYGGHGTYVVTVVGTKVVIVVVMVEVVVPV